MSDPRIGEMVRTQDQDGHLVYVIFVGDDGWRCLDVNDRANLPRHLGCDEFIMNSECEHTFLADQFAISQGLQSCYGDVFDRLDDVTPEQLAFSQFA